MRARAIISRRAVEIGVAGGAHGRPTRHGPRADGERSMGDALGRGVPAASGSAFCRSSAAAALQIGRRGGGGRPHRGCAGGAGRCSPPVSTGAPGAACVARAGRGGAWRRRFGRRLGRGGGGSAAARAPARAARLRGGGSGSGSGAAVPARRGASGSRRRRFGFRRRRFGRGGSAFATSAAAAGVGSEFRSATGGGPPRAPFHHMATMGTPSPAARGGKAGTRGRKTAIAMDQQAAPSAWRGGVRGRSGDRRVLEGGREACPCPPPAWLSSVSGRNCPLAMSETRGCPRRDPAMSEHVPLGTARSTRNARRSQGSGPHLARRATGWHRHALLADMDRPFRVTVCITGGQGRRGGACAGGPRARRGHHRAAVHEDDHSTSISHEGVTLISTSGRVVVVAVPCCQQETALAVTPRRGRRAAARRAADRRAPVGDGGQRIRPQPAMRRAMRLYRCGRDGGERPMAVATRLGDARGDHHEVSCIARCLEEPRCHTVPNRPTRGPPRGGARRRCRAGRAEAPVSASASRARSLAVFAPLSSWSRPSDLSRAAARWSGGEALAWAAPHPRPWRSGGSPSASGRAGSLLVHDGPDTMEASSSAAIRPAPPPGWRTGLSARVRAVGQASVGMGGAAAMAAEGPARRRWPRVGGAATPRHREDRAAGMAAAAGATAAGSAAAGGAEGPAATGGVRRCDGGGVAVAEVPREVPGVWRPPAGRGGCHPAGGAPAGAVSADRRRACGHGGGGDAGGIAAPALAAPGPGARIPALRVGAGGEGCAGVGAGPGAACATESGFSHFAPCGRIAVRRRDVRLPAGGAHHTAPDGARTWRRQGIRSDPG